MSLPSHSLSSKTAAPREDNAPVFQAPWAARAFAIVNQLATTEEYSWAEWTDQFVEEISTAEAEETDSSSYYERWVRACEKLLISKKILDDQSINQRIQELIVERESNMDHAHLEK